MTDTPSREERLAAKLRENLKRRKSQARGMKDSDSGPQVRKAERPPAGAAQPERSPGGANGTEDASAEALAHQRRTDLSNPDTDS